MRAWSLLVTSVLPFVAVTACGGAASTGDPASSDRSAETEQSAAPIPSPPPPAPKCPAPEPKIGSACGVPNQACTYGQCADPGGIVTLECIAGAWHLAGVGACGDAGARDAAHDAAPSCSGGGGANANGVCSSDRDFFASAQASCALEHLVLTSFKADEKCGAGSSNSFTFNCCAELPAGCTSGAFGNGHGICSTDTSLFASAEQSCVAVHASITAFALTNVCSPSTAQGATYGCCP